MPCKRRGEDDSEEDMKSQEFLRRLSAAYGENASKITAVTLYPGSATSCLARP